VATDIPTAYELLSKPTLEISDEEALTIIADLRQRRRAYLTSGKVDKPKKEKVEAVKLDKDEKARNTALLLASLKIPGQS
jgi:hypothetical protein